MTFRLGVVLAVCFVSFARSSGASIGHDHQAERLELRMPAHPGDAAGLAAAGDAARVADQATVVHRMAADRAPVLADPNAGKPTEWPELLGQDAAQAKEVIAAFGYNVILVPEGSAVTMDYRTSRVRVYVDKENRVQAVPRIG